MTVRAPLLALLLAGACDEGLPTASDLGKPATVDAPDVVLPVDSEPVIDVSDQPKNQCDVTWSYVMPESGIASQPVVDAEGRTLIAAGNTLRRVAADGSNDADCAPPFVAPGEALGSPSLAANGAAFVGTGSGKLFGVSRQCKAKWGAPVDLWASACAKFKTPQYCDRTAKPVREAPALLGDRTIFVLDATPAIHRIDDLGAQPDYQWPFLTQDTEPLPGATPVIAGGDVTTAFVAFPTRRTVVAMDVTGSRRWEFSEFLDPPEGAPIREITSPLALTADGSVVFAAGEPDGDSYKNLAIYQLKATSNNGKVAEVVSGFPRPLGLQQDAVRGIAVTPSNELVLAMAGNGVIRLDAQGEILWKFIGDAESLRATSVPTLGKDGSIFVTAEPRSVYGIDPDGHRVFRYESPGAGILDTTSPAISDTGMVLVHFGSELKAYTCTQTHGLAVSSFPRYQRNNRSSGRLEEPN